MNIYTDKQEYDVKWRKPLLGDKITGRLSERKTNSQEDNDTGRDHSISKQSLSNVS